MKTAFMGEGKVIVTQVSHPRVKGKIVMFSKSKKINQVLPICETMQKQYQEELMNNLGRGLFQIYFPDRECLKRLIDQLTIMYENWE